MTAEEKRKYNREYYANCKYEENGGSRNENSTMYYKKIKQLDYDISYILVKALHGNPIDKKKGKIQLIPHNIKIGE